MQKEVGFEPEIPLVPEIAPVSDKLRKIVKLVLTAGADMQQCGICSALAEVFRRLMCIGGSRRGSGESYYQELEDEETVTYL